MKILYQSLTNLLQGRLAPWLVLILSFLASKAGWYASDLYVNNHTKSEFTAMTHELNIRIKSLIAGYEQILRGGAGLFRASSEVSREDWKNYVASLQLEKHLTGLLGLGYAQYIPSGKLTSHIRKIRSYGFQEYRVKPEGVRNEYTSIIYLEPFNETNKRAFGYDMFSEPVRRAAMERARDTGTAALSGRVNLVQNASLVKHVGFLIYIPLYNTREIPLTVEERRSALSGYVYSPFYFDEAMRSILREQHDNVSLRIYDGNVDDEKFLLYGGTTEIKKVDKGYKPVFTSTANIELAGRQWLIQFNSTPNFDADLDFRLPYGIFFGGLLLSALFFIIAKILVNKRQDAFSIAEKMTEALRQTESRLQNLFEFAPDATVMTDEKGQLVLVNHQAEKIFQWSRDELIGEKIEILLPENIRASHIGLRESFHKSAIPRAMGGGKNNLQGLRKDGTTFPVEISLSPIVSGNTTMVVAAVRDISERVNAEKYMRKAMLMLDSTTDVAFVFEPDTLIFNYVNEGVITLLGYARDQIMTMTLLDIGPEFREDDFRKLLENITLGNITQQQMITSLRCKNGEITSLEINLQYVELPGEERCFIAIGRDVTERQQSMAALEQATFDLKAANKLIKHEQELLTERVEERTAELSEINEQLKNAKTEAELASRAKSAFLAAMSHEIRTPMNGVVGMVEILLHSELNENQSDAVNTIKESAFSLLRLIDDILDFSKIEAGKMELERTEVSLFDKVERTCHSLSPIAENKKVNMSLFVDPCLPDRIWSDAIRLRQVLYNLIGNAIKFSGDRDDIKGHVVIRVEVIKNKPNYISITIRDNGIGMTEETQRNLFTSFTQAEASTTRRFGGTGLGLAITNRLVNMMGGEIFVESTPDVGSQFKVVLPVEIVTGKEQRLLYDFSGLDCILVSGIPYEESDVVLYLEYYGMNVYQVNNLVDAAQQAKKLSSPIIISSEEKNNVKLSIQNLYKTFINVKNIRHILITKGNRRSARFEEDDIVSIDVDILRIESLLHAIAVAGGVATIEVFHDENDKNTTEPNVSAPSIDEARSNDMLILIAEDDKTNQKVILRQLELLGYAAEVANNGVEALNMWREGNYALLLSDLHMPELDGYGLSKAIRNEQGTKYIPILALTANALRGEIHNAMEAGMDEYLTKPVQLKELSSMLEKWMPKKNNLVSVKDINEINGTYTVFNPNILKGLVGNDSAVLKELLRDYLSSAKAHVSELAHSFEVGDKVNIKNITHKLKSSSRSVGAIELADLCMEIENAVSLKDAELVPLKMKCFNDAWLNVELAINEELENG